MRANLSDELMDQIEERIYLDIEIHMFSSKFEKANKEGNQSLATFFERVVKETTNQRKEVNDFLKQNGIKIYDVVEVNPDFVEYPYSQKINGGYKEGTMRFWRAAIKLKLKRRISKYFYNGGV
jgi:flagellar biosynthesis GTPase FlhF